MQIHRSLTFRFLVLLGLFTLLIAFSYATLSRMIQAERGTAAKINDAGRQRMFCQRIWALTEALPHTRSGDERRVLEARLQEAIAELDAASSPPAAASEPAIVSSNEALRGRIEAFLDQARASLNASRAGRPSIESENGESAEAILADLERRVHRLQLESEASFDHMRRRAAAVALLMGVLLAVSAFGVFGPLVRELMAANRETRKLSAELSLAEQKERRRIAEELHEDILQIVAAAKLQLASVSDERRGNARAQLEKVDKLLATAVRAIRTQAFELGPPVLYSLGLPAALRSLTSKIADETGLLITFEESGDHLPPIPEPIRIVLFRAVRELLANIVQHAQAREVRLALRKSVSKVTIEIHDDGRGFEPDSELATLHDPPRYGLFEIRERITYLGGKLEITSAHGQGTQVRLMVRLAAPQEAA